MKGRHILILISLYFGNISLSFASTYDHEIITMFTENVVEMPFGTLSAQINEVDFNPISIKSTLLATVPRQ